jgi:hypothetical protein
MIVTIHQCYTTNKFPFNLLAIAIRKFSRTNYSHYALSYTDNEGRTLFFDSSGSGVRAREQGEFLRRYSIVKSFPTSQRMSPLVFWGWFDIHDGKSYGFSQLVGLMFKIIGIIKHNPFGQGAKRIICNELVVLFLNRFYDANIKDVDSLDLNETEDLIMELIK